MTEYEPAHHSDDLGGEEEVDEGLISPMSVSARCPRCNYDLSGILESEAHRCPECGREWTIEELAHQYAAQAMQRRGVGRWLWVMLPGPVACVVLFLGLVFGHLVWWIAAFGVIGYVVITIVDWWQDAYLRSFAKGRGKWERYSFVSAMVAGYVFINVIEVAVLLFLVRRVLMME